MKAVLSESRRLCDEPRFLCKNALPNSEGMWAWTPIKPPFSRMNWLKYFTNFFHYLWIEIIVLGTGLKYFNESFYQMHEDGL